MAQQNEVDSRLGPRMIFLPQQPTEKQMNDIMSGTRHGVLVTGSAACEIIGPLMRSFDLSEFEDGFLFRVALPHVNNDEKFTCELRPDGTIKIQGVISLRMQIQYRCPPGDFAVTFHGPANVDPSTFKHMLHNGVLEGVVKKRASPRFMISSSVTLEEHGPCFDMDLNV